MGKFAILNLSDHDIFQIVGRNCVVWRKVMLAVPNIGRSWSFDLSMVQEVHRTIGMLPIPTVLPTCEALPCETSTSTENVLATMMYFCHRVARSMGTSEHASVYALYLLVANNKTHLPDETLDHYKRVFFMVACTVPDIRSHLNTLSHHFEDSHSELSDLFGSLTSFV
jgi:hypothetical protein